MLSLLTVFQMRACSTFKHFPGWNFDQNLYFKIKIWFLKECETSKWRGLPEMFEIKSFFFFINLLRKVNHAWHPCLIILWLTSKWQPNPVILWVCLFKLALWLKPPGLVYALQRHNTKNWKKIFPEKELRDHGPNSNTHVSVSDLCYIPTIGLPILRQEYMYEDRS